MPASSERPDTIGIDELRALETSVLKTLCLTINTAGSELKYKILDSLSDDDFYFPVLQAVFQTLSDMHLRGDYVISKNLEQELLKSGLEFPPGFSIETLFEGTLPSLADLSTWVTRLKERSLNGLVPTMSAPAKDFGKSSLPGAEATVVKSVAEVKRKIADEVRKVITPPPAERPSPPIVVKPKPSPMPEPREKGPGLAAAPKPKPSKGLLSSEGDDWSSYLEDLASQQGKSYDTGFLRLDRELGGLSPGLMLVVDEDRGRVVNFLKQVTDQVASATGTHCLFLTSEFPRTDLRLRTLSRLAMVPIQYIEKGRLKKDSPDWQKVDRAGRGAAEWLRRVFVYEVEESLELALLRELTRKLLDSAGSKPCFVVLDSLENVQRGPGTLQSAAVQLKNIADSLEVLIVAATSDPTLLASKDADYAAVFRQAPQAQMELEILRSGKDSSTVARFKYEPAICRFSEAE